MEESIPSCLTPMRSRKLTNIAETNPNKHNIAPEINNNQSSVFHIVTLIYSRLLIVVELSLYVYGM